MANDYLVTIVMPTYNRAKYIANAIDSVLTQTYKKIELIVIDDNKPESEARKATAEIIMNYTDSRIRYIQNEKNMGGALTRNVGIFEAKGEYIAFLDDDDIYLPTKIEVELAHMQEHDLDVCVMDGATYSYEKGTLLSERHQRITEGMTRDELIRVHLLYHISGTNTFMYKASFLKGIGGFDDSPSCQEYLLMQKSLDNNPKFGHIAKTLIKNFSHEGEQLSTGPKKLKGQMMLIAKKKEHFDLLTSAERRYVLCRHHGVLFFVHYKMHNYPKALKEAVQSFFASPKQAWMWYQEYKGKITQ